MLGLHRGTVGMLRGGGAVDWSGPKDHDFSRRKKRRGSFVGGSTPSVKGEIGLAEISVPGGRKNTYFKAGNWSAKGGWTRKDGRLLD